MSHFTTIQTQIRDLEALRDACGELGLGFNAAVEPAKENDGTYGLTTDWWDGHVAKEVGIGYGRLLQTYGVHKTMREARTRGLRVLRNQEQDGSVLLTLEGGSL